MSGIAAATAAGLSDQWQALLARGQLQAAAALAGQWRSRFPADPASWLAVARSQAALGHLQPAGDAWERAIALLPAQRQEAAALEQLHWLHGRGLHQAARNVLARVAVSGGSAGLAAAALALEQPARALDELARMLARQPPPLPALQQLLGQLDAHGQAAAAEACLQQHLARQPAQPASWLCLARLQRNRGDNPAALASCLRALALAPADPAARDLQAGLLLDAGQPAQALACARPFEQSDPPYLPGLATLANILHEHGARLAPAEHPADPLRHALARAPANKALRIELVSLLLNRGEHDAALQALAPLLQDRNDALARWYLGNLLTATGQLDQADAAYAQAGAGFARHPGLLNARTRLALRRGEPGRAVDLARHVLAFAPHDQEAWSLLSLAWRLLGDARYRWLCDYDRLVAHLEVPCPPGHAGREDFLAALEHTLSALHAGSGQPLVQSVRHGSQTSGRLFGRPDPLLQATEAVLQQTAQDWLRSLPDDPRHPFLSRRRSGMRIVGSWSVALSAQGHHANHIHSQGWLSSAFHLRLPPPAAPGDTAGHLQLGQPLASLGLDLPAERVIAPRPGWLALFPSYLWHGTVPLRSGMQGRLSIAFDAQPSG